MLSLSILLLSSIISLLFHLLFLSLFSLSLQCSFSFVIYLLSLELLYAIGVVVRTVLLALIAFMPTKGEGAIGALEYTPEERKGLAEKSICWVCPVCGDHMATALADHNSAPAPSKHDLEAIQQLSFKGGKTTQRLHLCVIFLSYFPLIDLLSV